jgi:hypothetical protein
MRTGFTGRRRAAFIGMTGAAAAAAVALAITPAGAAPLSPHGAAKISGTEHVQIMTTSATSSTASIVVWGAFTAGGVDHQGNSVDTLAFAGGTIKVQHSQGKGTQKFNTKTCLMTINEHGTYKFLSGTGKYKGITGHGNYVLSIVGVGARTKSGACSQTANPVAFQQVVDASGPVTLP